LLALATIALSWLLMHAVFGLRYAHRFYDDSATNAEKHAGGLNFPEDDLPDYRDFAYFSFVTSPTGQLLVVAGLKIGAVFWILYARLIVNRVIRG
jgi:uncharacterized membrane protein